MMGETEKQRWWGSQKEVRIISKIQEFCENQNNSRLPFYAWNVLNTFYYFHYDFDLSVDFESIDLPKYNVKKN